MHMNLFYTYFLIVSDQNTVCKFKLCKKSVGTDEIWHPSFEIMCFNVLYGLGTGVKQWYGCYWSSDVCCILIHLLVLTEVGTNRTGKS